MSGPIAKRAYICARDPLNTGKVMVRPDIPSGGRGGSFEGKRVMAYSSEEAAGLFSRGEDGMPELPWPLTLTLVRQRGHSKVEVSEPMKESETGSWEYQDYRRVDGNIVMLMDDRSRYDQRVIQDADVVIDQHGAVIKHRQGITTSEPMSAGAELLEQAMPVFPTKFEAEGAYSGRPEDGFDVITSVWSSLESASKLAIVLASIALVVSIISILVWVL